MTHDQKNRGNKKERRFRGDKYEARAAMLIFMMFFIVACGRLKAPNSDDNNVNDDNSATEQNLEALRPVVESLALAVPEQKVAKTFENAKKVPLKDDKHPWDGRATETKNENIDQADASAIVPNGDSKPPQMSGINSSCSELQPNRCVSCCEDYFTFGSENWDRCVASCPQLGLEQMATEY